MVMIHSRRTGVVWLLLIGPVLASLEVAIESVAFYADTRSYGDCIYKDMMK
jgi:hypothetical protein